MRLSAGDPHPPGCVSDILADVSSALFPPIVSMSMKMEIRLHWAGTLWTLQPQWHSACMHHSMCPHTQTLWLFVCLCEASSHGQRHNVFWLFVCLSLSWESGISRKPGEFFFKFYTNPHLEPSMSCLDFDGQRSNLEVTVNPQKHSRIHTIVLAK